MLSSNLCLAWELLRRLGRPVGAGIPVEVLEATDRLGDELRASTFHPPTLDLLEPLAVTDRLLERV